MGRRKKIYVKPQDRKRGNRKIRNADGKWTKCYSYEFDPEDKYTNADDIWYWKMFDVIYFGDPDLKFKDKEPRMRKLERQMEEINEIRAQTERLRAARTRRRRFKTYYYREIKQENQATFENRNVHEGNEASRSDDKDSSLIEKSL